jgi:hypothetical protein
MGGAGLAWPPLHCSFTKPDTSFAMSLDLLVQAYCLWQHSQIPRKKELIGAAKLMVMKRFSKQSPAFFTLRLSDWLSGSGRSKKASARCGGLV